MEEGRRAKVGFLSLLDDNTKLQVPLHIYFRLLYALKAIIRHDLKQYHVYLDIWQIKFIW